MEYPVTEIRRRQALIDEDKAFIKEIVGSLVGFSEDVQNSFSGVGHARLFTVGQEGWMLDIEPSKPLDGRLYIHGVMYVMDNRSVFYYEPSTKQYEFQMRYVSTVRSRLQNLVDTLRVRVPNLERNLGTLWMVTAA